MIRKIPIIIASIIVLVLVLFNTSFTVNFHEIAILTRFGKPAGIQREAGLHLKAPLFICGIHSFSHRSTIVSYNFNFQVGIQLQKVD